MAYLGKIFAWLPNTAEPVLERLKWLNTVTNKRDGTEQRAQVRVLPRRELDYSFLPVSPAERAHIENFLWASQKDNVLVPVWTDIQELDVDVDAGDTNIPVDTVTYDYDVGQYALFYGSHREREAVEIAEVHADHLVLAEPLLDGWLAGTIIAPARIGRVAQTIEGTTHRPDARPLKVTCRLSEDDESINRVGALSVQNYLGHPIFKVPPETSETARWSLESSFPLLDFQTGLTARDAGAREKPWTVFAFNDVFIDRDEISQWWAFLNVRQGRRVPFWIPTWERDFKATLFQFGGFVYEANGYAEFVNLTEGRRDIVIYCEQDVTSYAAGTFAPRRPTAVVDNLDGTESMTVSMSDFTSGEWAKTRISLLRFCRLEGDEVELAWQSVKTAKTSVAMREMWQTP